VGAGGNTRSTMLKWLAAEWHRVLIALLTLDHLWDRLEPHIEKFKSAADFVERRLHERRHTDMENILTYLGMAKYAIPVIDAIVAEIKAVVPVEKADIVAAVAAVEKAVADLKTAIEALITAVKAAIAST
jgi:hypothetical protein